MGLPLDEARARYCVGQGVHHLVRVVPGLLDRVRNDLGRALSQDLASLLVGGADRLQAPVLDFDHEQPAAWMQHDEIGMGVSGADGYVVPDEIVVIELLLQTLGRSAFTLRHASDAGTQCGDDGCHRMEFGP
jgi:hypothetical protein